ncbi:hypothetical protein AB6A40_005369 [Gnathostoma spinigerum]|uniref:PH domain-containing protein n=1 Tax=Gnathostoma spinigerum TaxID=75299 RepID=A0ABD6EQX1_9BILA
MSDLRRLKEGEILRYKHGFLSKKWKKCYAELYSDSSLIWYDEKGDTKQLGSIVLKNVVPYICIGFMCDRMPVQRPEIPHGYSVQHLVGIGTDPKATEVHWFLFASDADFESWFTEIKKTLPMPNPQPPPPSPQQPQKYPPQPSGYNPPPVYPSAPAAQGPVTYPAPPQGIPSQPQPPYGGVAQYPSQPQPPYSGGYQPGYAAQGGGPSYGVTQPATTVIVQDRPSSGGRSGPGFGMGMGAGLLMGSLAGYGLGSYWNSGPSGFGGFGSHGFGGGYVQDNDTNITNNYFIGGDTNQTGGVSNTDGNDQNSGGNQGQLEAPEYARDDDDRANEETQNYDTNDDYDGYDVRAGEGDNAGGEYDDGEGADYGLEDNADYDAVDDGDYGGGGDYESYD